MIKPLAKLGLGLRTVLGIGRKDRVSPLQRERQAFEADVRQQLIKLKEKGLSLPVFTL